MHSEKSHRQESAVQRKMNAGASVTPPQFSLESSPAQLKAGAAPSGGISEGSSVTLPPEVSAKMESTMDVDTSQINIKKDSEKAEAAGALAMAQGNEIHFAKGQYDPNSKQGQSLIGHEVKHFEQQSKGQVQATSSVNGMPVNDNAGLEAEADRAGEQAAQAKADPNAVAQKKSASPSAPSNTNAPAQRFKMRSGDIKRYPKFAAFVQNEIPKSSNDARLTKYMQHWGTNEGETARDINADFAWGSGPEIRPYKMSRSDVSFRSKEKSEIIRVNRRDIEFFENSPENQQKMHDMVIEANVLNGYTQFLDDQDGEDIWGKEGKEFEKGAFGDDISATADARQSRRANFGEGVWEVTVLEADPEMPQRLKVWNTADANGFYEGNVGNSFTVTSRPMNRWSFVMEHNSAGQDAKKGWKRNDMITTPDGEQLYTVRSDFDGDNDRNDLVVRVKRKGDANNGSITNLQR
jgi:hypothetical protein